MIECEVKLILESRDDCRRLLSQLPRPRRWGLQLNLYLDRPDGILSRKKMTLRLRVTPDHARITLKHRGGRKGCAFRCVEIEHQIDRSAAIDWLAKRAPLGLAELTGFEPALKLIDENDLAVSNWSLTHRAICDTDRGVTVEVDETLFPDGFRDFEVEAEHDDPDFALSVIDEAAKQAGVMLRPQGLTKHARAIRHSGERAWVIPEGDPSLGFPCGFEEP